MTKREKLIVSAYTGVLMTDWSEFHKFIEERLGRPIFTHGFASKETQKELREVFKEDFLKICEIDDEE